MAKAPNTPSPAAGTGANGKGPLPKGVEVESQAGAEGQGEETPAEEAAEKPPSRFFAVISSLTNYFLLVSFVVLLISFIFVLDFLDILQFRYKIPATWREKWPLKKYYDYVKLNQLPQEERFQALLLQEKDRYDRLVSQGGDDLKKRAEALEASYKELVRTQMDFFRKKQAELAAQEEDLKKRQQDLEKARKDLEGRKEGIDVMAQQISSEAVNLESSLIRFMEDENRLKPVQEMTAAMDPRSVATMFDEVTDSKLIFDILKGIPPERSALILSYMDPDRAGKIVKMSTIPPALPAPGSRPYIPPSLKNLVGSAANLK